jgi:hypothetical protein
VCGRLIYKIENIHLHTVHSTNRKKNIQLHTVHSTNRNIFHGVIPSRNSNLFKNVEPCEALLANGLPLDEQLICLVLCDDLLHPDLIVVRVQDLVQSADRGNFVSQF